jgi:hypothetical protein
MCTKMLQTLPFIALQIKQNESSHVLEYGTKKLRHPLAFSTTLTNNEAYCYNQAMKQPYCSSYGQRNQ